MSEQTTKGYDPLCGSTVLPDEIQNRYPSARLRYTAEGAVPHSGTVTDANEQYMHSCGLIAAKIAHDENPNFKEKWPYDALSLMLPGERIYIPQQFDTSTRRYELKFHDITLVHQPAYDGFPGAGVAFPMSELQWQTILCDWVINSALDLVDIVSDTNLCFMILVDDEYASVPMTFKVAFVCINAASFLLEIASAYGEVKVTHEGTLKLVGARHGTCTLVYLKTLLRAILLRYTGIHTMVLNATVWFHGPLNKNKKHHKVPLLVNRSEVVFEYDQIRGFLSKLPKVLLEDFILFGMNLWMTFMILEKITVASVFAAGMSLMTLLKDGYKFIKYVKALRKYGKYMAERISGGDLGDPSVAGGNVERKLFELLEHPVRRLLLCGIDTGVSKQNMV